MYVLLLHLLTTHTGHIATGNKRIDKYRLDRKQAQRPVTFHNNVAPSSTPPSSWLTITDYNVSTTGGTDISHIVDQIGRDHSHGCVLRFPGGLGSGGAAAGNPPSVSFYVGRERSIVWC